MPTWGDDFHRANGNVGPALSFYGLTGAIVNNQLVCTGTGAIFINPAKSPGYAIMTVVEDVSSSGAHARPSIKSAGPAWNGGYYARFVGTWPNGTWELRRYLNGPDSLMGSGANSHMGSDPLTYTLAWSPNTVVLSIDGVQLAAANNGDLAIYDRFALIPEASGVKLNSITCQGDTATTISVSPNTIGVQNGATPVRITGLYTTWTPGTPGTPLFSLAGAIVDGQVIAAPTAATATVTPPVAPITTRLYDPISGVSCPMYFVAGSGAGDGGITALSPTAIAYIERSAIAQPLPTILNQDFQDTEGVDTETIVQRFHNMWRILRSMVGINDEAPSGIPYVDVLWSIMNGHDLPDVEHNILTEAKNANVNAGLATLGIAGLKSPNYQTLYDVAHNVSYGPGATIENVFTMLGITDLGAYPNIVAAIEAARGVDLPTIRNAIDMIGDVSTIAGYTLGDVLDAIGNIQPGGSTNLTPVLDAIAAMRGNGSATVSATQTQANAIKAVVDALATSLGQVRGSSNHTIQTILDAIDNSSGGDYSAVLNAISALRGNNTSTVKAIEDSLAEYRTGNDYTVADILDKIKATEAGTDWTLPALGLLLLLLLLGMPEIAMGVVAAGGALTIPAILEILANAFTVANGIRNIWDWLHQAKEWRPVPNAPAYPGYNEVDWGVPSDFVDAIRLPGLMDGAIIRISTPGRAPYAIKEALITRYSRLGTFAFQCDETSYEHIQPVQFLEQLATPKAMNTAIAILVQCKPGTVGTVTPYKLKSASPWPILGIARL